MQERQCKVLEFKAYEVAEEVKLIFIFFVMDAWKCRKSIIIGFFERVRCFSKTPRRFAQNASVFF